MKYEKEARHTLSVNAIAYEELRVIQTRIERDIGFKPTKSQEMMYLATKVYYNDKLTGEQNV
jgi:hypothetical protein